jgi:hypothetical protein
MLVVPIQDQTDHDQEEQVDGTCSSARLAQMMKEMCSVDDFLFQVDKDIEEWRRYTYRSRGAKELISQGLLILERLTQDQGNCTEIRGHRRLLSKITSPLSSPDFLSNVQEDTMVEMLGKSLTVVSRLLACPGPWGWRHKAAPGASE